MNKHKIKVDGKEYYDFEFIIYLLCIGLSKHGDWDKRFKKIMGHEYEK